MPQQFIFIVAYDGTRFHGFQRQHANNKSSNSSSNNSSSSFPVIEGMKKRPRVDMATGERLPMTTTTTTTTQMNHKNVTIQDCLECAILQWLSTVVPNIAWSLDDLNLRVAGRTDKGVHARGQVVAVQLPDVPKAIPSSLELWKIQKGIHGRLPIDISIRRVLQVSQVSKSLASVADPTSNDTNNDTLSTLFDPRRDAKEKRYSYTIKYQRKPTPTPNDTTSSAAEAVGSQTFRTALDDSPCLWLCHDPLDDFLLQEVCRQLAGTHDYSVFVHKAARAEKDNTLTITRLTFEVLEEYEPPDLFLQPQHDSSSSSGGEAQIVLGRFIVEGQRFRRTMVRNLVGFAVDVARGKESLETESLWTGSKEAAARVHSAPPTGLCLEYVKY